MSVVLNEIERAVLRDKVARARLSEEDKNVDEARSARATFSPEDALLVAVLRLSDEERGLHLRRIEREATLPAASPPRTDRLTGRPPGTVVNRETDGRLRVDLPGAKAEPLDAPWHGSIKGYLARLCRCYECRDAWSDYQRAWRARRREAVESVA